MYQDSYIVMVNKSIDLPDHQSNIGINHLTTRKIKTEKILGASQNVFSSQKTSLDNFNLSRSTEK